MGNAIKKRVTCRIMAADYTAPKHQNKCTPALEFLCGVSAPVTPTTPHTQAISLIDPPDPLDQVSSVTGDSLIYGLKTSKKGVTERVAAECQWPNHLCTLSYLP